MLLKSLFARRIVTFSLALSATVSLALTVGCSDKAPPLSKDDKAKFNAPLGQPMPPEAKAAMEKMGSGPPPGATAPAKP